MKVKNQKLKVKSHDSKLTIIIFSFVILHFAAKAALAQIATSTSTMKSEDYMIHMPNFNFASGNITSEEYRLGFTGGENAIGLSNSDDYRLRAGFSFLVAAECGRRTAARRAAGGGDSGLAAAGW